MKISALDVDLKNRLDRKDNLSLIDLGSYQYSEIEKDYSRFRRCPELLCNRLNWSFRKMFIICCWMNYEPIFL